MGGGLTCSDRGCALRVCGCTTCADPTSARARGARGVNVTTPDGRSAVEREAHDRSPHLCRVQRFRGRAFAMGYSGFRTSAESKVRATRVCSWRLRPPHLCSVRRFGGRAFALLSSGLRASQYPIILNAYAPGPAVRSGVRTFRFSKRAAKTIPQVLNLRPILPQTTPLTTRPASLESNSDVCWCRSGLRPNVCSVWTTRSECGRSLYHPL